MGERWTREINDATSQFMLKLFGDYRVLIFRGVTNQVDIYSFLWASIGPKGIYFNIIMVY